MNHTPIVKKAQGHSKFSVELPEIRERQREIAAETRGHFISGPSATAFLNKYMPWNDATPKDYRKKQPSPAKKNLLASMAHVRESAMYEKYIKALANWPLPLQKDKPDYLSTRPKLGNFRDPDTNCGNLAVDIGVYDSDDMPEGRTTDHSLMETQTELKAHANYDAFVDLEDNPKSPAAEENGEDDEEEEEHEVEEEETEDESAEEGEAVQEEPKVNEVVPEDVEVLPDFPFENDSIKGRETRGQISCYAGVTMMLQHRSHLFTILICGPFARFIRWDRSGAIVSERFDYTQEKTLIFNFYKRFAQLSPSQRGKDPTVSPLIDEDDDAIARAKFDLFDTDMWHGDAGPKPKRDIKIEDQKLLRIDMTFDNETRRFVVCAPKFDDGAFSPFGRSTRRSLAVDLDSPDLEDPEKPYGGLLFMKDYWRENSPRTVKESDIYHLLAQHNVPHVAKMQTGGDVPNMVTITQQHARALPNQLPGNRLPTLQAHRIFLKTIGRDLTTFCSVKSLVTCIADAMKAHQVAFDRACILHRDISVGNIMITPDHRGFLIDWDHCVILTDRSAERRVGRTGTWQFMSARLLGSFGTTHTLVDDRESSLWVLLYVALRYTPNSLLPVALHHDLKSWFQDSILGPRGDTGGAGKRFVLNDKQALPSFYVHGLNELLRELADVFAVRYQPEPTAQQIQKYEAWKVSHPDDALELYAGQYSLNQEKLANPTWLLKTLRKHAKQMKVPKQRGDDWCKNACYSQEEFLGSSQKRKATSERLNTKRLKGLGGETHSFSYKIDEDEDEKT
ncbi:hypothetical protein ARMSODRAFT_922372 [Armillaria solidipes]|uniref:Protein kinase domain-containing protein n=1 Tax=Armillaria solidipes TaxID=1076256 RepID=A0A2H3B8Q5_9AGAR|nr:hypothetical protein ARMSODRAFT_922372 [Armillaria solidipes]